MESFIWFLILLLTVQSVQVTYFRLSGKYDHAQARSQCKKHGGILATIRNKNEHQKAVEKCFEGVSRPNWRDDDCRIGLHYVNNDFTWLDTSTPFSYNQIKNPSFIARHKIWSPCFNLEGHYGKWKGGVLETTHCSGRKKVLCEKRKTTPPVAVGTSGYGYELTNNGYHCNYGNKRIITNLSECQTAARYLGIHLTVKGHHDGGDPKGCWFYNHPLGSHLYFNYHGKTSGQKRPWRNVICKFPATVENTWPGPKKYDCETRPWVKNSCRTCVPVHERKEHNHCRTCHRGCNLHGKSCRCGWM